MILQVVYIIICLVVTLTYVYLINWYCVGWRRIPEFRPTQTLKQTKVAIIIPARNEESNIINLLNGIKKQTYKHQLLEIFVIDDHSDDATADLVKNFDLEQLHLLHLSDYINPDEIAFKKRAIEIAIAQTQAELIITTDADCTVPPKWVEQIVRYYQESGNQFIVAPVDYAPLDSLLKKFQEIDFLTIMAVTGASVQHKQYNLSNGANMAYTKKAFEQVQGYHGKDQSPSGDDVFLIEKIGKAYPNQIGYLKNTQSIVNTLPCSTFKELVQQRLRWISKTKHYSDAKTIATGSFFGFFYFILLISLLLGIQSPVFLNVFIIQFLCKIFADFMLLNEVNRFYKHKKLLWLFPLVELIHFPFTLLIGVMGQFVSYSWKNRTVSP